MKLKPICKTNLIKKLRLKGNNFLKVKYKLLFINKLKAIDNTIGFSHLFILFVFFLDF